jgi:shikimate dehydrogenase
MSITAKTQVLAVFGDPVAHSLSPVMHNGWIEDHGLDAVYVALPLKSADAALVFRSLKALRLKGANVTVPHKEAAAAACDKAAAAAVNTLLWEAGKVSGFNTDGQGFLDALDEAAPGWRSRTRDVLIVGAGGGARGIAEALQAQAARLRIVNRTYERAQELAGALDAAEAAPWDGLAEAFARADLIVQTTTLGMSGSVSPDWPVAACKADAVVVDIVYRPLETPLLKAARESGLVAVDGLGMLIHQGALAFELWFGIKPDTKKARERLMAALRA